MNSQHWRDVEDIYQSAIGLAPVSRGAFLDKACRGDDALRREVESLLEMDTLPQLIDQPAWEVAPELLDDEADLEPGTELGPYRVETVLGAGGIGKGLSRHRYPPWAAGGGIAGLHQNSFGLGDGAQRVRFGASKRSRQGVF